MKNPSLEHAGAHRGACAIEYALQQAGAPLGFQDLTEPIGPEGVTSAVRFAHLVRARFTLGDLLSESGWLDAKTVADVLRDRT